MASAKKTAPAKKAAKPSPPKGKPTPAKSAKPAAKPATKPAAAGTKQSPIKAPAGKPALAEKGLPPTGGKGAMPVKRGTLPASAGAKMHAADEEAPVILPKFKLEKHPGKDTLCQIEIVKEGHFFIARTQTDTGAAKEYKNTVFEDLLTEMVITLQEQLQDK